jgi:hypothetical protein
MRTSRLVTPSLFAVAAILFLLPFFSVSCTGQLAAGLRDMGVEPSKQRVEVTGSELVLERVPDRLRNAYRELEGPGTAHPLAIALGASVAAGIVLSGLPRRLGGAAGTLLGLAGIVLLIRLGWALAEEARARVQPNAREFIDLGWEVGAWAVAGLLAGASLHGLYRLVRRDRPAAMLPP